MRKMFAVVLMAAALGGCATAEQMAAADDAECRSWGVRYGHPEYPRCRAYMSERRRLVAAQQSAAFLAAGAAIMAQGQPPPGPIGPVHTSCSRVGGYIDCTTR